jgi:hypothetical protein
MNEETRVLFNLRRTWHSSKHVTLHWSLKSSGWIVERVWVPAARSYVLLCFLAELWDIQPGRTHIFNSKIKQTTADTICNLWKNTFSDWTIYDKPQWPCVPKGIVIYYSINGNNRSNVLHLSCVWIISNDHVSTMVPVSSLSHISHSQFNHTRTIIVLIYTINFYLIQLVVRPLLH